MITMAKKVYTKLTAYDSKITADGPDKSKIVIKGQNSTGTVVEVSISVDDYFSPYLIKDMARIAQDRVNLAIKRRNEVKDAVNL